LSLHPAMYRISNLILVFPHGNMKKTSSKVGCFLQKIADKFITALMAKSTKKKYNMHLHFYGNWDV
jgi:hypothetical protein